MPLQHVGSNLIEAQKKQLWWFRLKPAKQVKLGVNRITSSLANANWKQLFFLLITGDEMVAAGSEAKVTSGNTWFRLEAAKSVWLPLPLGLSHLWNLRPLGTVGVIHTQHATLLCSLVLFSAHYVSRFFGSGHQGWGHILWDSLSNWT